MKKKGDELIALFNTSYWIVLEGLAFQKFASLCKLQIKNKLTVGENYQNIMGCRMFVKAISETILTDVQKEIKDARFLSFLSDGSTDSSQKEQEIVYTRYVQDGLPKTQFLGIKHLRHCHAAGTLEAIEEAISTNIDLDAAYGKAVNCNFDGASVMSGSREGVRTKMQKKQPAMAFTHCIAHKLELAVLDSIKCDENLEKAQEIMTAMFLCYYYSPKKRREIQELSNFLEETFRQFGGLKNVRWLASRDRALDIIIINYKALVMHQENLAESKDKNAAAAKGHVKELKSMWFLAYSHFMIDYVKQLRTTSLMFQRDTLLVCIVKRVINARIQSFETMKIVPGTSVRKFFNEITTTNDGNLCYKEITLNRPPVRRNAENDVPHSVEFYKQYYKEKFVSIITKTQDYLKTRFADFNEAPLSWMTVFDFKSWPQNFDGENASFGVVAIESLAEFYREHVMFTDGEADSIPDEWVELRHRIHLVRTADVTDVYRDLIKENAREMKNILVLVKLMATISPSTATCERGFSTMKREKTNLRTSLSDARLEDIIRISVNGVSFEEFEPSNALDKWLTSAKKRHLGGHKLSGPRGMQQRTKDKLAAEADNEIDLEIQIIDELIPLES